MTAIATLIGLTALSCSVVNTAHAGELAEYQAFWLKDERQSEYVVLVLSRVPLHRLVGAVEGPHATVLNYDAVKLTTYAKDSIWNIDMRPIKILALIKKVEKEKIQIAGEVYSHVQADLKEVLRIFENPEGKIRISRFYRPSEGQEAEIKEMALRLRKQIGS
jgi:hypothetical protein